MPAMHYTSISIMLVHWYSMPIKPILCLIFFQCLCDYVVSFKVILSLMHHPFQHPINMLNPPCFFKYWYTSSLLALKLFMCPLWVCHFWRYLLIILSRLKFYLDSKPSPICTLMPSLVFSNTVSKYLQCSCIIVPKLIKNHLLILKCHTLISITPMISHL